VRNRARSGIDMEGGQTTSQYIYEHLFVDGEGSDLTIVVLGKTWRLHKTILCQSNYFRAMFNGSWTEFDQKLVNIDIADDNINIEVLTITFGSMYKDDIDIDPAIVVGVLAAATLFCLDPLIDRCTRLMVEKISSQTAGHYHAAGKLYGQLVVERSCLHWLKGNLMMSEQSADLLRSIDADLMSQLVASSDLLVLGEEKDLYSLLTQWLYLKLNPDDDSNTSDLPKVTESFIRSWSADWAATEEGTFLELDEGKQYAAAFRALRLHHVIYDSDSL
jgi:BTB/POZ domain-containing protein 13